MAFLEELQFTGSLGDLSFYRMRGSDKIVVRRKGGASKETIKKSPNFAIPRLYMSEFGGCSTMGKEVRFMMHPLRALADYNFSGFINKSLKLIQKQDSISQLGQRAIELSKYPKLLEGFQLNKYTTFDSMVRSTLTWSIDVEKRSAKVDIPALVRDINFFPNNRHSKFSVVVSLGIVPDFKFNQATRKFEAPKWYTTEYGCDFVSSEWHSALKGAPATTLELSLDKLPPDAGYSLMLGIGIAFGDSLDDGEVKQIKRAGAAKILGIVAGRAEDAGVEIDDSEEYNEEKGDEHIARADQRDNSDQEDSDVIQEMPHHDAKRLGPQASRHHEKPHSRHKEEQLRKQATPPCVVQSFTYTYVLSHQQTTENPTTYSSHYNLPNIQVPAITAYSFSGGAVGYGNGREISMG